MIEPPSNFIYLTHGAAAFLGTIEDNAVHKHYAIQLTIGVDGAFTLETDNGTKKYEISILDSNTEHKLVGNEGVQLLLLIEPDSLFATSLRKNIDDDTAIKNISLSKLSQIVSAIKAQNLTAKSMISKIFALLGIEVQNSKNIDKRVQKTIDLIDATPGKKISIDNLSQHAALSDSRLQHLFKQQVGISIKHFLLWKRILDGIKIVIRTGDLTYSAYEAGFSDSAHMSRAFKRMFGLTLSDLFKNNILIHRAF